MPSVDAHPALLVFDQGPGRQGGQIYREARYSIGALFQERVAPVLVSSDVARSLAS